MDFGEITPGCIERVDGSVVPMLRIRVPARLYSNEIPLDSYGALYWDHASHQRGRDDTSPHVLIATVRPESEDRDRSVRFSVSANPNLTEDKIELVFLAELNERHLNFLEKLRHTSPKRNIRLSLDLTTRVITSNVTVHSGPNIPVASTVSAGNANTVATGRLHRDTKNITISGSDWVADFLGPWSGRHYVVFEVPLPESLTSDKDLQTRLELSIKSAEATHQHILQGNWPEACRELRPMVELWRKGEIEQRLKNLLLDDGYSEVAAGHFQKAINELFELVSKFAHATDKYNKPQDIVKPMREDATLAFLLAKGLLDAIAQKAARREPTLPPST